MVKIRKLNHIKAYVLLFYFSFLERKYLRNKYKDTSFPFEHNYNTESIIFEDTNFKVPPPPTKKFEFVLFINPVTFGMEIKFFYWVLFTNVEVNLMETLTQLLITHSHYKHTIKLLKFHIYI